MEAKQGMHKEVVGVLLLGGLVGAGAALLSAPVSGRETRKKIGAFAEDAEGRARCYIYRAQGRVTSAFAKGKELFQEKKSIIMTAFGAGREAYERETKRYAKERCT